MAKPLGSDGRAGPDGRPRSTRAGLLQYGTTYYWRVDEVNAPPDSTIYKGKVWSFTTEPYAYMVTGVTATASSAFMSGNEIASKTTDGSGLDATGSTHSNVAADGWLTALKTVLPAWISYDLGQAYLIQQMHVWNSNQSIEAMVGFGAKDVLIESSLDGVTWASQMTEEFEQADGTSTYAGFTVDMNIYARYIRLTIQSNWSALGIKQTGLSEVRFLYVPVQAREPNPGPYARRCAGEQLTELARGPAGGVEQGLPEQRQGGRGQRHGAGHDDDRQVPPACLAGVRPELLLEGGRGQRCGEHAGVGGRPVWAFTTAEWAAIDDFESLHQRVAEPRLPDLDRRLGLLARTTTSPTAIRATAPAPWSAMILPLATSWKPVIIHGGRQSMPVEYNNVNSPYYSEVERTWDSGLRTGRATAPRT